MAKSKSRITFTNPDGYRFVDEKGDTTAVLEASGKFTLRDAQSALEIFDQWSDWLISMGEKPTTSLDEADVLDQLTGVGLGRSEPVELTPSSKRPVQQSQEVLMEKENQVAKKVMEMKAAAAANKKKKAPVKEKGAKKEPAVLNDCVCGCGEKTARDFKQGHDARVHGWFKKIERGETKLSDYPACAQKWLKDHGVKAGSQKKTA